MNVHVEKTIPISYHMVVEAYRKVKHGIGKPLLDPTCERLAGETPACLLGEKLSALSGKKRINRKIAKLNFVRC